MLRCRPNKAAIFFWGGGWHFVCCKEMPGPRFNLSLSFCHALHCWRKNQKCCNQHTVEQNATAAGPLGWVHINTSTSLSAWLTLLLILRSCISLIMSLKTFSWVTGQQNGRQQTGFSLILPNPVSPNPESTYPGSVSKCSCFCGKKSYSVSLITF